tara:strand:- start:2383 stop:2583 length:201 start_codon:yes stop_codon:yes gene_type:complete
MAQLIEDATVSLKINGVVSEMYPDLNKDQIKEVSHFVFHRMSMIPVYEQAQKLIKEYVDEELNLNI